jgi:hypothetical protein
MKHTSRNHRDTEAQIKVRYISNLSETLIVTILRAKRKRDSAQLK